jgi:hypothetical protein
MYFPGYALVCSVFYSMNKVRQIHYPRGFSIIGGNISTFLRLGRFASTAMSEWFTDCSVFSYKVPGPKTTAKVPSSLNISILR